MAPKIDVGGFCIGLPAFRDAQKMHCPRLDERIDWNARRSLDAMLSWPGPKPSTAKVGSRYPFCPILVIRAADG